MRGIAHNSDSTIVIVPSFGRPVREPTVPATRIFRNRLENHVERLAIELPSLFHIFQYSMALEIWKIMI
jgi:hypothetical protein